MYTDTIDLNSSNFKILTNSNNKPIIIGNRAKVEIEEKELEAIIDNIVKEYEVEFKRKIREDEPISAWWINYYVKARTSFLVLILQFFFNI